ncbi:hypothetical protein [Sulfitobacter sp. M368]|uniref:hypothetical protein n=1 Tax=Sulfitobacter sp. M368 TaxID=2867021 RepID=UPI0021A68DCA|nr:hypothetical protein [Sulfitobacter sp. M368]
MQFNITHVLVTDPEDIRLVGFEPRERGFLKIPHDIGLLYFRGIVLSMECNDPRCVSPFASVAVDQVARQVGIAGQYLWGYISPDGLTSDALAVFRIGSHLLCHEVIDR